MDFYKRTAAVCKLVPPGKVATYGQIALLCEKPRHSRQVGFALNKKITDDGVPAHRIINHQGYLSGASAFEQPDMQKLLLEGEGIAVEYSVTGQKHKVDLKSYQWKHTLEDLERIKMLFSTENI